MINVSGKNALAHFCSITILGMMGLKAEPWHAKDQSRGLGGLEMVAYSFKD